MFYCISIHRKIRQNPRSTLDRECGVLAANLCPKSVFGEDTLVNVSFEKQADGKLSGYIRIRSKTRGIALQSWGQDHLETEGRPLIGEQA
ncbi:hypothetical protein L3X38_015665 [Prunus dulcis]|uniref:Coatomer beta subunit appendage platform domain-containing protein n=1 Tax=Prunus dulcis TaxID=3755 RepID=A0AAD4Z918_PRUDU|nr:hypothetical protein L3X38_015665 [Prunus dulcis]